MIPWEEIDIDLVSENNNKKQNKYQGAHILLLLSFLTRAAWHYPDWVFGEE